VRTVRESGKPIALIAPGRGGAKMVRIVTSAGFSAVTADLAFDATHNYTVGLCHREAGNVSASTRAGRQLCAGPQAGAR